MHRGIRDALTSKYGVQVGKVKRLNIPCPRLLEGFLRSARARSGSPDAPLSNRLSNLQEDAGANRYMGPYNAVRSL